MMVLLKRLELKSVTKFFYFEYPADKDVKYMSTLTKPRRIKTNTPTKSDRFIPIIASAVSATIFVAGSITVALINLQFKDKIAEKDAEIAAFQANASSDVYEAYSQGYDQGMADANSEIDQCVSEAYSKGYEDGYEKSENDATPEYLFDSKPYKVENVNLYAINNDFENPYVGLEGWHYAGTDEPPMSTAGITYEKGMNLYPYSNKTANVYYNLQNKYSSLLGKIGFDDLYANNIVLHPARN